MNYDLPALFGDDYFYFYSKLLGPVRTQRELDFIIQHMELSLAKAFWTCAVGTVA